MGVFLIILKVIGIVLAVILTLVGVLLLLILFCPVTYRVCGTCQEKKLHLKARVWWLGCLLGIGVDVADQQSHIFLRIAGIRKNLNKTQKEKSKDNPFDSADTVSDGKSEEVTKERDLVLTALESSSEKESHTMPEEEVPAEKEPKKKAWKNILSIVRFLPRKIRSFFQNVSAFPGKVHRTVKKFIHQWKKWMAFVQNEQNKMAFAHIWKECRHLIKLVLPGTCKLNLSYSTGSPDTTGQLLGILAMFPVGYRNNWKIMPDFTAEEFYIDATFDVRGHLFGIQILAVALRILLDKNCKKLYNRIKRMK